MLVHRKHNSAFYRENNGTFRCGRKKCALCTHVKEGLQFQDQDGSNTYSTSGHIRCTSQNLVYGIFCEKCAQVIYVGETKQTLYARHLSNFSRIRTSHQDEISKHFSSGNQHSIKDYKVFGIQKTNREDEYRKAREVFWISKLKTLRPHGLNTKSY